MCYTYSRFKSIKMQSTEAVRNNVSAILKEIEDNPVVQVQTMENNEPVVRDIDYITRKEIIVEYLNGSDYDDIAANHSITPRQARTIVEQSDQLRLQIEKKYFAVNSARENLRISEVKNKMIQYLDETLKRAEEDEDGEFTVKERFKTIQNVAAIFDKLDHTYRLNTDQPTSNTQHTEVTVDMAKILETLKTPEDKIAFLQRQSSKNYVEGELVETT